MNNLLNIDRGANILKGFNTKLSGGRWVTLKNDNKVYIRGGVVVSGQKENKSPLVEKVLTSKENEIYNLDYERAVVVYSDGTTTEINGEARQVNVASLDKSKCKDQIFTHNHPSWKLEPKKRCSPLSIGDMVVGLNLGFKELRAVAKSDGYSMKVDNTIEVEFGYGVVRRKKVFKRGEIDRGDMINIKNLMTSILDEYKEEGNDHYRKLIDDNVQELEAQRSAQIFHYDEAFKEIQRRIKGVNIKKISR